MANVLALGVTIAAALRDEDQDAWYQEDIYAAILEAENLIIQHHPHASARDIAFTCADGIKQSISALTPKGVALLDVKYNVVDGEPGRPIRRVAMADLDAINPLWRSGSGAHIREFMVDDREPEVFYVNPPADESVIQISYSALPAWIPSAVSGGTVTVVRDTYTYALTEFALYRLLGHDVENSVNVGRSQQHLGNFASFLGMTVAQLSTNSPKNPEHKR